MLHDEPFVRATKEELRVFWTDRFTPDELRAMAGALDTLRREDEGQETL